MKGKILMIFAAATLIITATNSQAGLGWSFDECVQHYGETTEPNSRMDSGRIMCEFSAQGYVIYAYFMTNTVSRIAYRSTSTFDTARVQEFLAANGPGASWKGPYKDESDGSYRWEATKDGTPAYVACLTTEGHTLLIWTQQDDDFAAALGAREANGL
jgi:hypothetical protein